MKAISTRIEFPAGWETWNGDKLLTLVKNLKAQNEALIDYQNKFTERREAEQEEWKLVFRCLEDKIVQLREDLALNEKKKHLASLRYNIWAGLINRQTLTSNIESELENDELSDFRELLDLLPLQHSNTSPIVNSQSKSGNLRKLKEEIQELRSQVSALVNEKTFVWEQYKILEENLTNKVKRKQTEIEQSKEEIENLLATKEMLQGTVNEKEIEITRLKNEITANTNEWEKELCTLSMELDELKKTTASQSRASLSRCNKEKNVKNRTPLMSVKQEVYTPSIQLGKESNIRSKRKTSYLSVENSAPKLFSSSFKVPKVKALPTL